MQLARDPVHGGLGSAVGNCQYLGLTSEGDAAHSGGDGHEFGRFALLEERVGRLKENEGADGVDLRGGDVNPGYLCMFFATARPHLEMPNHILRP